MWVKYSKIAWITGTAMLLSCASPQPMVMEYQSQAGVEGGTVVWPQPPEVARYLYLGALTGLSNFGTDKKRRPSAGVRMLRWLVGLGTRLRDDQQVLVRPQSGTVDDQGRIIVTDSGRGAVFVFDENLGKFDIWEAAGGFSNFVSPVGVVALPGQILVSDPELGNIVRLDPDGEPLGTFAQGMVDRPTGLARDSATGLVYVADTRQHDVKVFTPDGTLVNRIGGPGVAPGRLNAPTHLSVAGDRLYVSDTLNARVQIFSTAGEFLSVIGKRGLYVGNLTRPKGVAVDDTGNVYIVESYFDHLLIFDRDGRFLLPINGTGEVDGRFYLPAGVWTGPGDRIFVADMFNGRVAVFRYLGS